MSSIPAVLISDGIVSLLENEALRHISFTELTGKVYPWEIEYKSLQEIRTKLHQAEAVIRNAFPDQDITCVLAGKGAYWLAQSGLDAFIQKLELPLKQLKVNGPVPVWKLTTGEIFTNHVSNMRQLVLAVAHDLVLLEALKESLGTNHNLLTREFQHCERTVCSLLEEIREQGPNLVSAVSDSIMIYERSLITREMLERGEMTEEELGYTRKELNHVIDILDRRCREVLPTYRMRLQMVNNRIMNSLRDGESTQLTRAGRWDYTFAMMGVPPVGYRGQAQVASVEREGMAAVVSFREVELGESDNGQSALSVAEEAKRVVEKPSPPPPPPVEEPSLEEQEILAKKATAARRMQVLSRGYF